MMIRVLWAIILLFETNAGLGDQLSNCPKSNIKFEKVIGLPTANVGGQKLLFRLNPNDGRRPITNDCLSKCKVNNDCQSFVLYYDRLECYWYLDDVTEVHQYSKLEPNNEAAWFVKLCLQQEKSCNRSWIFERVRGATLVGNDTKVLPNKLSKTECEQMCLDETTFECKSIKFRVNLDDKTHATNESYGLCILSNTDRYLMPTAYRVSTYDDFYMENQCSEINQTEPNREIRTNYYCTYEEYEDVSLSHGDVMFQNKTKDQCQAQCEVHKEFNCRGFSIIKGATDVCILHSEDTKLRGPRVLEANRGAIYYEKARCLHINVSCSESFMTIRYQPETDFRGKLYMQGYSENPECYVVGQGKYTVVTLKLPLLTSQCGIIKADSPFNRTLLAGTLIIQYNAFIQTQSDRILKVGCIFGNQSKVLIGTGVTITSNLPNKGSTLINTVSNETVAPIVEMRVVDLRTQEETTDTQIGQELQLIIELKEKTNAFDLWASHLIAMTEKGEESIFLLDDRGCPTNLNIFPALQKVVSNGTRRLLATFQAFKFASSPIVRFSVIVQFCPNECPPIKCDKGIESFGKRKREINAHLLELETVNGNKVVSANNVTQNNRSGIENLSSVINQMPLEYVMTVRDSNSHPDRLILGNRDGKILVAGYDYTTNEVCMDYSLVIGLIVTWIIVQLIFIIACIALVKRYKKHYERVYSRESMEELHKNFGLGFSNLENRRVRWADNGDNLM